MSSTGGYAGNYPNYSGSSGYKQSYLYCYVDNGNIVQIDPYSTNSGGKVIGVITPVHESVINELNDLRDTCMGYYNKLVEAKLIKVAKTPEEIADTTNEVLVKILERLEKLEQKEVESTNEHTENN